MTIMCRLRRQTLLNSTQHKEELYVDGSRWCVWYNSVIVITTDVSTFYTF